MTSVNGVVFPGGLREDGLPAGLSDPARLAAVRATGLLDTGPEEAFDDLARLAAAATGCTRAFITLVDDQRSFWKSRVGPDAPAARQAPVRRSFCYFLVGLEGEPFVVDDAATDPRTRDHPSVAPVDVGAWAGYPVLGPGGEVLGSMCVVDDAPRRWRPEELKALATLARAVSNELNLRHSLTTSRAALATARTALSTSTELARSLQDSLLPPTLTPVPGLETAASYLPAEGDRVVGDFYDLFQATAQWWCTVLGDVCGHGTEAAKVTALARYTLRAEATRTLSPATILARLNTAMLDQHSPRFLTAVHATFRTTRGGVAGRLCLAGHPPALIRRADGRVIPVGRTGTLLGIVRDVTLTDVRFRLAPGDALLLYTDGATEARPPASAPGAERPQLTEEGLALVLADCHDMTARQVVTHIGRVIAEHNHDRPDDDTALLALRVPPRPERHTP
ncbi:PP2C family protein-serine/threonine phosphatase [Saccharothrix yanglingensis]|uniref:PP2C family protein-serine/threonine phosphatase n=1 Tax=Saccharothrix yanglingensis TaxID=659496 RepID=UPI0027D32A41|nr:GAF domain-containing SpoIIE family protein phosphatase [Saccharothrix yanglingensis]